MQTATQALSIEQLRNLAATHTPGYTLDNTFYQSADVFERDLEHIFMRSWLYVGHESQIPASGDYFLFDIAAESIIIVRDEQGDVHALANVCRHRGSRVCLEASGNAATFVCGYHGWVYSLDGKLRSKRYMPKDFDAPFVYFENGTYGTARFDYSSGNIVLPYTTITSDRTSPPRVDFMNRNKFQIICAGRDNIYAPAIPSGASSPDPPFLYTTDKGRPFHPTEYQNPNGTSTNAAFNRFFDGQDDNLTNFSEGQRLDANQES